MSKPVSVIVPVFNVELYLRAAVDSILNQTFTDFELILVNDGSTDSSPEICEDYAKSDTRVVVVNQKNAGFGEARNTGLKHASGEYIFFMDSDDWTDINTLKENYALATELKADTLIFGHRKKYSASRVSNTIEMIPPALEKEGSNILTLLDRGFGFSVWEQFIRRQVILDNKLSFPSFQREADVAFLLEFYQHCNRIYVNPKIYYTYNSFYSSIKFNERSITNHKELYSRLLQLIELKGTPQLNDQMKTKFFVLWFCHVVPINYVASPLAADKKNAGLAMLMNDETINRWANALPPGKSLLVKISLALFSTKRPFLMYRFTALKLMVKKHVKMNFKKRFYS